MIEREIAKDVSGTIDLCRTYTTDGNKDLLQVETGTRYTEGTVGVKDVIVGFDADNKPYGRYRYIEIDKE